MSENQRLSDAPIMLSENQAAFLVELALIAFHGKPRPSYEEIKRWVYNELRTVGAAERHGEGSDG